MKVKYIGPNPKVDTIPNVGLRWDLGQVRDVTSTVAEQLLVYTDTWVKDESEIHHHKNESLGPTHVEAGRKEEPVDFKETEKLPEVPLPVVNFHAMKKDALIKFATEELNEKFDKRQSEDMIRERVIKLHSQQQMDDKLR